MVNDANSHRSCLHRSVAEPPKDLAVVAERWPQLLCSRLGRGGCCSRFLTALICSSRGILAVDLHSDGRYRDLLYVDGGVSTNSIGHLRMEGKEVFRHAVSKLAATAEAALGKAGLGASDIDWVVPHQANIRIIQGTAKKLNLPMERVVVTVQDHGNTSAASIPLALSVGRERGQINRGDLIVTEAIGGGLAWGSVVLRW